MQPFAVFGLTQVIEQDLAKLHDDQARRRAAEGYPADKAMEQASRAARLIAMLIPSRQPKTTTACGD
jgi:hypothetical protein